MNKTRIIYTGPFDPTLCNGVASSTFDLLRFFKSQGHEAAIITFMHDNYLTRQCLEQDIERLAGAIISRSKHHCHFMLKEIDTYYEVLPYSRREVLSGHPTTLKRYIKKIEGCSKSYFLTADADFTCLLAHLVTETLSAHFFHSPAYIAPYSQSPFYQKILKYRNVFAVSRFAQEELKKALNVDAFVWPPFIDLDRFRFSKENKSDGKIGYYSGGPHKGDDLVDRLIREMPHCHFVIMGHAYTSHKEYANLTYLGDATNLDDFYGEISLLLVPSKMIEGYSRVVLEAACNGIPTIANRIGGIPEALGHSGILIDIEPSEDKMVSKYVSAITRLLDDPGEYEKYSHQAFARAQEYEQDIRQISACYGDRFLGASRGG